MTLRPRLLLAQAPLAAALLLVGAASLRTVSYLGEASAGILKDNYRSLLAAHLMTSSLDALDRSALLKAAERTAVGDVAATEDPFEVELRVQEGNITEPGEAEATARLRAAWEDYRRAYAEALAAPDPLDAYAGLLQQATAKVRSAIDEVVVLNQDAIVRKSDHARRESERLLQIMMVATAAALALGLFASFTLTTLIVRPLSRLSLAVRRFGEGDLDARASLEGRDEIAGLARDFDNMADNLAEYRKSSLGELLQAQQASQAAIDSLPDPVLIVDTQGNVFNLNRAAESLLGLSPDETGQRLRSLDPPLRDRLEAVSAHVLGGRGPFAPRGFDEAIRVELPEGPRQLLPRATALYSAEGAVSGVSIVLQDVTRLVRFDELKNDLVATVAHEFRTPLTSLRMAVHLVAEEVAGPLTEKQADLVAGARQDCERLQGIVDDILDLSRVNAGRIERNARTTDGGRLLRQAALGVEGSVRKAEVKLSVETPPEELSVVADSERVEIVIGNLLGNAVRHTPPGGRVTARVRSEGSLVRFEVEDTGEGVPRPYQERIFERFFQVPGAKRGGVGLGLYISREIVRAHGGDMGLTSEEGRGSTFWFTLPSASEDLSRA